MHGVRRVLAYATVAVALLAVPAAASAKPHATIHWTPHGIPRIEAKSYKGLGYGYGYALASQEICNIADSYVTVNAQRSRYFGPAGSWRQGGNGTTNNNLDSDFFYQRIINNRTVEKLMFKKPPSGPVDQVKQGVAGYVQGYNAYLKNVGVKHLPDPTCRGAAWVKPISKVTAYRRFYQLAVIASSGVAITGIAEAAPLVPSSAGAAPSSTSARDTMTTELGQRIHEGGIGSNAVALGSSATDNHRGMLLGNPHFPWDGSERFFESQLTIPGKVNVSGASLIGAPIINIGHTDHLAWSHTVSTAYRFTPFEETLVPGSPTSYMKDGQTKQMKADQVTVKALQDDGSLADVHRTLYSTDHGPIFTSLLGLPLFPWTPLHAYAMGDANAGNFRLLNHFYGANRAQSVGQLYRVIKKYQGVPWVNTIASDSGGHAFYADISVTPHVTNSQAASCDTALGDVTFTLLGLPTLDGSRSACDWGSDSDSLQKGTFGPSHMPHLFRSDYVTNSNDSYWLSNPKHKLEGFARIIGDERTPRALRTRSGLTMVRNRLDGSDGLPGNRFTIGQLRAMVFSDRQYFGQLVRNQLVNYCNNNPTVLSTSGGLVNVSAACPILAAWDVHDNLDSKGAVLFRQFAAHILNSGVPLVDPPAIYQHDFNVGDPVNTPNGLNTLNPLVGSALGAAVKDLQDSGIPLDGTLRNYQYDMRGSQKIPIHGGPGTLGVFNAINVSFVKGKGYPNVPHGSSFVMTAQFQKHGCPKVWTILTYSQSPNPKSPFFADQTKMFSKKQWVREPFCAGQIARHTVRTTHLGG